MSESTAWEITYEKIAIAFDATLSDRPYDIDHLYEALLALVDMTSVGFGSEVSYGTEAAVDLLSKMDLLYRQARQHYSYDGWRNKMVSEINKFTILYFGDLAAFVNALSWPDECVPYYWAELSANDSSIDTSEWIICS